MLEKPAKVNESGNGGEMIGCIPPVIDYPQAGEKVLRGHYSIRISGGSGDCQAAIDGGDWQSCRTADGYHWYDWSPEKTGSHRISVRVRSGHKWVKVQRTCRVV
jgi:hypothetical protein